MSMDEVTFNLTHPDTKSNHQQRETKTGLFESESCNVLFAIVAIYVIYTDL